MVKEIDAFEYWPEGRRLSEVHVYSLVYVLGE